MSFRLPSELVSSASASDQNHQFASAAPSSSLPGDQPPAPSKPGSLSSTGKAPGLRHILFPPATPVMNFQLPPDVASPTKSTMSFRFPPSIASPDRPVTNPRLAPLFVSLALLTIGLRFASSARFLARREQLLPACAVCFSSCRSGCQLPIRYGIISYCEATTVQSVNASANPCNACGFHQGWCNCFLCAAFVGHSRQFALIFHRQKKLENGLIARGGFFRGLATAVVLHLFSHSAAC
jgi:hypothetical protein